MEHTNKFYKILRIVFLTLAIISIVFTLLKKVGLCAQVTELHQDNLLPLQYGQGIGYDSSEYTWNDTIMQSIIDYGKGGHNAYNTSVYEGYLFFTISQVSGSAYTVLAHCVPKSGHGTYSFQISQTAGGDDYLDFSFTISTNAPYSNIYTVYSDGTIHYDGDDRSSHWQFMPSDYFVAAPGGGYTVPVDTFMPGYVLGVNPEFKSDGVISDLSGTYSALIKPLSTHSTGGDDADFYESIQGEITDIFEKTNIISGVASDMTTPSLFERLYLWLLGIQDTIYQGFNNIWLNFKSLFQPMIDNIANFTNWIRDKWLALFNFFGIGDPDSSLSDFLDYLQLIYEFLIGQGNVTLQDVIEGALDGLFGQGGKLQKIKEIYDWFYSHGLKNGEFDFITLWDYLFEYDEQVVYSQLKTSRYGAFILSCKTEMTSFFTALTSVTAADHVQFTIPIGTTLGGVQIPDIVIDFDWYADIRDTFLPWFMAFLYVTVIWCFWKSLPNIIHGVAGDVSTFTDALGGDEFAPTSHGLFTHGVSHNQPSLDKAPLSGGGGVHSGASQFWY